MIYIVHSFAPEILEDFGMADKCVFCRIVRGEIPCSKVYENENILAFLDLAPVHPGHTLVIPKVHYANIKEFPCELSSAVCMALKKVAAAVEAATGAEGINIMQNNGLAAGQTVFHIHWHIIPRFSGDGLQMWPQGSYADAEAMQAMALDVAARLKNC